MSNSTNSLDSASSGTSAATGSAAFDFAYPSSAVSAHTRKKRNVTSSPLRIPWAWRLVTIATNACSGEGDIWYMRTHSRK